MNRRKAAAAVATFAVTALATLGTVTASTGTLAFNDFSSGTGDWTSYGATVANENGALRLAGTSPNYGAFSYYDGVAADEAIRESFPADGYVSELAVHLDTAAPVGSGFDLSSAISTTQDADGVPGVDHRRDFIFHVGKTEQGLFVNASNNTDFALPVTKVEAGYEVTADGIYTLQHVFRDDAGVLAVDMNLINGDGDVLWTTTLQDPSDSISLIGGPRYLWATYVSGSWLFDDQLLEKIVVAPGTKDDCKDGGFEAFGFDNQGQCVASVVAR